jgi:hypothetical protein
MSGVKYPPDIPPPVGGTTLVLRPGGSSPISLYRETDTRTAMTRGLKEYLEQLELPWPGGRTERFRQVFSTWAEPEDSTVYPSACVYSPEKNVYGGRGDQDAPMSPQIFTVDDYQVARTTECVMRLSVDVWTQDPVQREIMCALLEDALWPVDWMAGFHLVLPHYHGVTASYLAVDSGYIDTEEDDARRYRKATFVVEARMAQLRVLNPAVRLQFRAPISINGEATPSRVAGPKLVDAPTEQVTNS